MRRLKYIILLMGLAACAPLNNYDFGGEYLGAKYMFSPLGESTLPDADPLIRTDAFDCTTYVETVLAGGDVNKLTQIRYKNGVVSFLNRNHFIETDWLNNNANIVENVSAHYAAVAIRSVEIDKSGWMKQVHGITADFPINFARLEYIPYQNLGQIKNRKPLIVLFITDNQKIRDKIGTDLAVAHMGFLMPGGKILRHASSEHGRVMDTDFAEYVMRTQKNKNNIGIALVRIK